MRPFPETASGLILEGASISFRPRSTSRFGVRGRGLFCFGDL
jgi:hypothetical protein